MTRKTAFVTGAARGLGKEIARVLGEDGHALYLVDILGEELEATAAELRAAGVDIIANAMDVSKRQACFDAVADCVARSGDLTVLINNAGIMRFNAVPDVPEEEWNRILAINLSGPFFLIQAALPHLVTAHGNIVNICSSNGLTGTAFCAPYSMTKAALINLTKTLAVEHAEQPIRVNALCPGPMETGIAGGRPEGRDYDWTKVRRYSGLRGLADPAEVARVVGFLASDAASTVHGAIWTADTGTSAG